MRRPHSVRSRLLLATVGVVSLALAIGVTAFNLLLGQRLDAAATSTARAQAEAELSSLRIVNGRVLSPHGSDDGVVPSLDWVYAGGSLVEAPRAKPGLDDAAAALAGAPQGGHTLGEEARLYALPIAQRGIRYGTVVSAVPLRPYQETARTALLGSIALATLLLATMTALSWWMLGRALLPVQHMTESAAQWSEHNLDERFALGEPRDEFTRLAATLDGLLERIAESRRHEQRFSAEISHELRTPLARVKGETELLLRRPRSPDEQRVAFEEIERSVVEMTATVDTLLAAARHEAGLANETADLRDAVRVAATNHNTDLQVALSLTDRPVRVAAESELLTRMVQPLLDNAFRHARSKVTVEVSRQGASACVRVDDDGPGVPEDEAEIIFEPGRRGTTAFDTKGAGLGLPLARRLARSVGGDVTVDTRLQGGHFSLHLPARQ